MSNSQNEGGKPAPKFTKADHKAKVTPPTRKRMFEEVLNRESLCRKIVPIRRNAEAFPMTSDGLSTMAMLM
jgi:hypothetical protein